MTVPFQNPGSVVVIRSGSDNEESGQPPALPPLPLVHFRLRARMNRPWQLPDYAGSPLRGIFGHALRATACRCADDNHAPDCLFACCFVSPSGKQGESVFPYVILPPLDGERRLAAGETFSLEFVVTGETACRAGEYVAAWHHALGAWLGDKNGHAVLDKVELLLPEQAWPLRLSVVPGRDLQHPVWRLPPLAPHGGGVTLHFETPLRIHREGKPLAADGLDARTLCLSLLRRLQGVFGQDWLPEAEVARLLAALDSLSLTGNRLRWRELTRYSNRQEREVKLGGLTGSVRLEGNLTAWLPLIVLGQVVHLGKNTTLGFGHYRID